MTDPAGHGFNGRDTVFFGFMRQHRPGDAITDRKNSLTAGLKVLVDGNKAAFIHLNTKGIEAKPGGQWPTADGDQHAVGLKAFGITTGSRLDR